MEPAGRLDGGRRDLPYPDGLPGRDCLQHGRPGWILDATAAFGDLVPLPGTGRFCGGPGGSQRLLQACRGRARRRQRRAIPYSYLADAGAIFAAFQRVYGVDLSTATMHWWRFSALLEGLLTHNFEDRVQYRITEPGKIKDKARREHYYQMRRLYQLDERLYQLDEHGQPAAKQAPMTLEEYNDWMLQHALQRKER